MLDKVLAWVGNVVLASVLVMLSMQQAVLAQDTGTDPAAEEIPGKITIPLTGTAKRNRIIGLVVSPSSFDTGLVDIGDTAQQRVTLSHDGNAGSDPIVINDAELVGASAQEFSTSFNGFTTLFPGDSIDVDMVFTPATPGDKSGALRLAIEGSTSPYMLLFSGKSRFPLTSDLVTSDALISFGTVVEGAPSTRNFILTNEGATGAPVINVSAINLSGDTPGSFNVNFTPTQLAPGQSLDVQVQMLDNNEGFKAANVEVFHDGINPTVEMNFEGEVVKPASVNVEFAKSTVNGINVEDATALQFGPDNRLYVTTVIGYIYVYDITRNGPNNYSGTLAETISLVKNVPNHNDNGANTGVNGRLVTGIHVVGTPATPIIYLASSDPRQAAGPSGNDSGLDTNSGILHKLTKTGGGWVKQDLVRGLPRSEENHVPNGLVLQGNNILLLTGGHTNMGATSNNFALLPEYALSAAVLEINLGAIGGGTYDLPTLDDEDRPGGNDNNDPFGGNNGKNQAKLIPGSPVTIYASGFRNAYDLVLTESGKLYTFDNGPNPGWGGDPVGACGDDRDDTGLFLPDNFHLVTKGSYGGHPNPTRGSKANTFNNSNPQSPIEGPANGEECEYKQPGQDGSLTTITASTNGLTEYRSNNFAGAMRGDILAASFGKNIYRLQLNGAGTAVVSKNKLFSNVGTTPLDVWAQGEGEIFPGTIWVADNGGNQIIVFEPGDY